MSESVGPLDVTAATISADTGGRRFRRAAPVVVCRNRCAGTLARTYVDQESGLQWLLVGPTHGHGQEQQPVTRAPLARLIDTPDGSRSLAMVTCRRCRSGALLAVGAGGVDVVMRLDAPTRATVVD